MLNQDKFGAFNVMLPSVISLPISTGVPSLVADVFTIILSLRMVVDNRLRFSLGAMLHTRGLVSYE